MRKTIFNLSSIAVLVLTLVSCNKEETIDQPVDTRDIADDVASVVGISNSGLSFEIIDVAQLANEYDSKATLETDFLKSAQGDTIRTVDTTFMRRNPNGWAFTYQYSFNMEYGYVFEGAQLASIYYRGNNNGVVDAPRIGSSESRSSTWEMTGLELNSAAYVFNGTTMREGQSASKVRRRSSMNSNSQVRLSDVKVDKSTLAIVSGTLRWAISGTVNGQSFNFEFEVKYLGDNIAEVTINGDYYKIDVYNGEVMNAE